MELEQIWLQLELLIKKVEWGDNMKYILALDQGTTSSRAIVFNKNGEYVYGLNKEFKQIYPKPGWVEHDPMDILNSQIEVAKRSESM